MGRRRTEGNNGLWDDIWKVVKADYRKEARYGMIAHKLLMREAFDTLEKASEDLCAEKPTYRLAKELCAAAYKAMETSMYALAFGLIAKTEKERLENHSKNEEADDGSASRFPLPIYKGMHTGCGIALLSVLKITNIYLSRA